MPQLPAPKPFLGYDTGIVQRGVNATQVAQSDGQWTMSKVADLYIKHFIETKVSIRSFCGMSYEAVRNRVIEIMRMSRSLSLVLDGRDGQFDDLDRGVNSPGWYLSMIMVALPAANGQRNSFTGFNSDAARSRPDGWIRAFANTRDFLMALADEVARNILASCAGPTYVAPARGAAGQITTSSPFAWANMVSLATQRDVWASPYSDRILVTRGDGGPAMLVHPTHNVVFVDRSGAQRSGPAFCEVRSPYWEGGMLMRGDVSCYVPGMSGRLRSDQIVSANPYALRQDAWYVARRAGQIDPGTSGIGRMKEEDIAAVQAKFAEAAGASGKPNPVAGLSDAALGSLFTNLGTAIGTTAAAIAAAIASGNQVEIARIQSATQMYIADMQRQGRTAEAQNAVALNTSLANNAPYIPPSTDWTDNEKMAAAGAGILVIGLAAWLLLRKKAKKNPVIQLHDRRFFVQAPDAPGFLARGFSVVGKTSSTRRRRRAA